MQRFIDKNTKKRHVLSQKHRITLALLYAELFLEQFSLFPYIYPKLLRVLSTNIGA